MSPKRVPQLSDAAEVVQGIQKAAGVRYAVLVPNMKVWTSRASQLIAGHQARHRIAYQDAAQIDAVTRHNIGLTSSLQHQPATAFSGRSNHATDVTRPFVYLSSNGVFPSQGLERAIESKASEVAIFIAATETFSRKNIGCSVSDSLLRYKEVAEKAKSAGLPVRGYISVVAGCPYEASFTIILVAHPKLYNCADHRSPLLLRYYIGFDHKILNL